MGAVGWSPVLLPLPGARSAVGVGVRVCLARQLRAVALGSHRRPAEQVLGDAWREADWDRARWRDALSTGRSTLQSVSVSRGFFLRIAVTWASRGFIFVIVRLSQV